LHRDLPLHDLINERKDLPMTTHCFYHSADFDGHCSGAIVLAAIPDCVMRGINYGDEFPLDQIGSDDTVFMVDFSLQPFERMSELKSKCKRLVWIDHHKSAIDEAGDVPIEGVRLIGRAACELTWGWFHEESAPWAVKLLGRYDVWDLEAEDGLVMPFQWGLRIVKDTLPGTECWDWLLAKSEGSDMVVRETIDRGRLLLEFQAVQDAKYCSGYAFASELDGLKVIAVNRGMSNSQVFVSVWDPDAYDAMCSFCRRPDGIWTISLYTDKPGIDVGAFCKAHGGGGHVKAAGFQTSRCPF
jgi:oligoribonuclease NrnB/cAMP/cGMP phosphodiesterase (DHH superfamily)